MCGIIFIYSKNNNNVINYVSNSFKLILNRGYDAIGICYKSNDKYIIDKKIQPNDTIIKQLFENISSNLVIGHSRWITNGSNTINNAHPHVSNKNNIILVHNGIIHNYNIIRNFLKEYDFTFYSDTDTEIIANLIEYYIIYRNLSVVEAIKLTNKEIKGTWALIILCPNTNKIYFTKHGSPLLISENPEFIIATSETNGFNNMVDNYIVPNDYDIFELSLSDNKLYSIYNYEYDKIVINNKISLDELNGEMYWMIKEIKEQPERLQKLLDIYLDKDDNILFHNLKNIDTSNIKHIVIIGCGTSYHAGLIAEKYFKSTSKFITIHCYDATEFKITSLPNIENTKQILCLYLSQSGETIDVYNCIKLCKNIGCGCGCINLAIINKEHSLIARNVDYYINIHAGNEIAVASTKSFLNMIVILSLLQLYLKPTIINKNIINYLKLLPNIINSMLNNFIFINQISNISKIIHDSNIKNIFILGKNTTLPIAIEGALKLKEITYIHAEAFSYGSLKHGPLALIDETNYTIILVDYYDNDNYHLFLTCYNEIISRNTNVIIITNNNKVIDDIGVNTLHIILHSLDFYNEIFFAICLQYLSFNISVMKSINPDKPRNLAKVVTVE